MARNFRTALVWCASLFLAIENVARGAEVVDKIDWPSFMARHDLAWNRLPDAWGSGAFMGNGLLGANVFSDDKGKTLMWRIGRTDVVLGDSRIPIGEMALKTSGDITGGEFRVDLWNAELTGVVKTNKGEVRIRSFTHAQQMVQVIEIHPDAGEATAHFEWHPGLAADPRKVKNKEPIPEDEVNPAPQLSDDGDVHACVQRLTSGYEHSTAWTSVRGKDGGTTVLLSVGYSRKEGAARQNALEAIDTAKIDGLDGLVAGHRQWWHQYWPESFLSIPDTRLESFYWIQMYKLASTTRADRPAIDLMGPWFNTTPWPKIWWNLNIQLTYWAVLTSNRLELGESLCKMIDNGKEALAKNAKQFSSDSYAIGRSSSYDCVRSVGHEICDLPWALHNYYLQYRYSMDEPMMRDRLFPLLKGSINYYLHLLKESPDGYLHLTDGYSPEYPEQPTPNPDCNIDLALLRWGCQTLLDTCERLKIDDPLIPRWKEVLQKLVPYPRDENGLKVSASVPFAVSHRHYSHLLMVYPLYTMNLDQPENRELVVKTLNHWMGMPNALRGYSYTGAASISALMGKGDDALMYLNKLLDTKILPNTMYVEAGPVIETPLSAAASVHDMLLTSWGGKIRVFPGVPNAWRNIAFQNLRTEGAFLVSATRKDGKLQFIRIQSLAGQPCRLVTDMPEPSLGGTKLQKVAEWEYKIDLRKGETVLVLPAGGQTNLDISAVEDQKKLENYYGLH